MKDAVWRRLSVLAETLWFVPGLIVIAFAVVAIVLPSIERRLDTHSLPLVFPGDAEAARNVLSTVAGSIITVAGITLSITMVTLQLVSTQYTPRALRQILRDKLTQVTAGAFVGVFIFSLIVLRSIRDANVPSISVSLSIVLAVGAVGLLLAFLDNVANSIQVSTIAGETAGAALEVIRRRYPDERRAEPASLDDLQPVCDVVRAHDVGHIQAIETSRLGQSLPEGKWTVEFTLPIGDLVGPNTPVAVLRGRTDREAVEAVRDVVQTSSHRTLTQDEAFALRLLADIALRALSPGVNDPTTAVLAIHHAAAVLDEIARRFDPPRGRLLRNDEVLVVEARRSFADLLAPLAEVARHCSDPRPLEAVLTALGDVARTAAEHGHDGRAAQAWRTATTAYEEARERIPEEQLQRSSDLVDRALSAASTRMDERADGQGMDGEVP